MAALRPMLAVAREEACVISAELASTARAAAVESAAGAGRMVEMEGVSPAGMRAMAEASAKEALGESSLLRVRPPTSLPTAASPNSLLAEHLSLQTTSASTKASAVGRALENDLQVTLRETIGNATQTGAEEQMDQVAEVARGVLEGRVHLPELAA